jgi:hypothetical protein
MATPRTGSQRQGGSIPIASVDLEDERPRCGASWIRVSCRHVENRHLDLHRIAGTDRRDAHASCLRRARRWAVRRRAACTPRIARRSVTIRAAPPTLRLTVGAREPLTDLVAPRPVVARHARGDGVGDTARVHTQRGDGREPSRQSDTADHDARSVRVQNLERLLILRERQLQSLE